MFVTLGFLSVAALSGPGAVAQSNDSDTVSTGYQIDCLAQNGVVSSPCRVDLATYIGWRVFHSNCASCHASDALGSSFAPALAERIQRMNFRDFAAAMDNGYAGLEGITMPVWGENPDVARYYRELWAYLSARSTGDLPPGPVERLRGTRAGD